MKQHCGSNQVGVQGKEATPILQKIGQKRRPTSAYDGPRQFSEDRIDRGRAVSVP